MTTTFIFFQNPVNENVALLFSFFCVTVYITKMGHNMDNCIRRAGVEDLPSINKLLYEVQNVHSDIRPDLFKPNTKKYNDEQLTAIINDDKTPVFVYESGGVVLGYVFCIFRQFPQSETMTDIKTLFIDDLCVDESARGLHIGTKLYEFAVQFAKEHGCYNISLIAWAGNVNALSFYKSMGMNFQRFVMEKIL